MKSRSLIAFAVLLVACCFIVACSLRPSSGDSDQPSGDTNLYNFSQDQISLILDSITSDKAKIPLSLQVPAWSFYRFDFSNEAGGHRCSTIITFQQALSSATVSLESTARVLLFDAARAKTGRSYDFFEFAAGLPKAGVDEVVAALEGQCGDPEFILNSSVDIGSATSVAAAVNKVLAGVTLPGEAPFVGVAIASDALEIPFVPSFPSLSDSTMLAYFSRTEIPKLFNRVASEGLLVSGILQTNIPLSALSVRLSVMHASEDGSISGMMTYGFSEGAYSVVLPPTQVVTGSLTADPVVISMATPSTALATDVAGGLSIAMTYTGDRGTEINYCREHMRIRLNFEDFMTDNDDGYFTPPFTRNFCTGFIRPDLMSWGYATSTFRTSVAATEAAQLECVVTAGGRDVDSFTVSKGQTVTRTVRVNPGTVATLTARMRLSFDKHDVDTKMGAAVQRDYEYHYGENFQEYGYVRTSEDLNYKSYIRNVDDFEKAELGWHFCRDNWKELYPSAEAAKLDWVGESQDILIRRIGTTTPVLRLPDSEDILNSQVVVGSWTFIATGSSANPSTPNIIASYAFEDGLSDDSGAGNIATSENVSFAPGLSGQAAVFDGGMNQSISLPDGLIETTGRCTMILRFMTAQNTGGLIGYQNASVGTAPTQWVPLLSIGLDGKLIAGLNTGTNQQITTDVRVNDGAWHKAALVIAQDSFSLYLDDEPVGTKTGTFQHLAMTENQLGAVYSKDWANMNNGWYYFTGSIDSFVMIDSDVPIETIRQL